MNMTNRCLLWQHLLLLLSAGLAQALSSSTSSPSAAPTPSTKKVLVTGASGKTGRLVFSALLDHPDYTPMALVRSESSGRTLRKSVPSTGLDQIVVCDVVTQLSNGDNDSKMGAALPEALTRGGYSALIICTSAMPTISKRSLIRALIKAPWNLVRGKKAIDFRSFKFVWKKGQYPEKVRSTHSCSMLTHDVDLVVKPSPDSSSIDSTMHAYLAVLGRL